MEMIDHKDRSWIIQLLNAGKTISEIQRLTGITRPTIYKVKRRYEELMKKVNDNPGDQQAVDDLNYFVENGFDRPKQTRQRVVFTPEIEEAMKQIIKEDEERLAQSVVIGPKHKIPGKIIFEILRDKHGYTGGVSTINHRVQAMRDDLKPQEGFAKQKWQPGYNMQYDFGNLILVVGGKKVRIHLAIGVLPFSGYIVCFAYYTEKMEVFVDSLTKMFEFFGGIPTTVTFDNMKNVVARFIGGGEKEYTKEIIRIANFYHFAILTTNPYSGWEKGVVERSVRLVKERLFYKRNEFKNMNDLQSYIDEQVAEINLDHSKKFNEEKKVLQPLHGRYEQVMIVPGRKVNKQALVRYLNVDYSVPDRLVGRKVDLRVYPNRISIYYEQEKVAEHERLYGGDKKNVLVKINYQHHTKIYLENPQGLPGSDMVDGNPELQEICGKYFTTKTKDGLPKIDCKGFARFLFLAGEAGIPVEELEDHVQDFLKEEFQSLKKEEKESSKDAAKVAKKSQDQIKKAQSSLFIGGGKKNDK